MKTIIILSLLLLQAGDSTETFWQAFKTAVTKHDVEAVARLSKFPLEMSYGISSIKTKAQLTRRYRQVFNEQTDAAACFAKAKPEIDTQNPKLFTVACPNAAGDEVVIYHFAQTKAGWKFTGLDNLNE
jgi:aminopeptidase N